MIANNDTDRAREIFERFIDLENENEHFLEDNEAGEFWKYGPEYDEKKPESEN
jgi:hypothetical protein